MADSSDGKHQAGVVGLAALLGLAGAGRGACRGATTVAREGAALSHAAPTLLREGALVGAGAHAAGGVERAGVSLASEGSHLSVGARAAEGAERRAAMLAREGAAAGEGISARDLAHEALGNAGDVVDLGSSLFDDDDDDDGPDAVTDAGTGDGVRRARATLDGLAEPPSFIAVRPPRSGEATAGRFGALPGVTMLGATGEGYAEAVLSRVRAHRGRGVVVVYGPVAAAESSVALRLTDGRVLGVAAMDDACRAVEGGCVMLLCAPSVRCDEPEAWRAAAAAWAATITAASRSEGPLTAARWEWEVPRLDRRVVMMGLGNSAVRVAWAGR